MAIQTVGRGGSAQAEVSTFYVPPPEGKSIFAEYWHNFHQTRSKWSDALFKARLQQAGKTGGIDYESLAKLHRIRADLIKENESTRRVLEQQRSKDRGDSLSFIEGVTGTMGSIEQERIKGRVALDVQKQKVDAQLNTFNETDQKTADKAVEDLFRAKEELAAGKIDPATFNAQVRRFNGTIMQLQHGTDKRPGAIDSLRQNGMRIIASLPGTAAGETAKRMALQQMERTATMRTPPRESSVDRIVRGGVQGPMALLQQAEALGYGPGGGSSERVGMTQGGSVGGTAPMVSGGLPPAGAGAAGVGPVQGLAEVDALIDQLMNPGKPSRPYGNFGEALPGYEREAKYASRLPDKLGAQDLVDLLMAANAMEPPNPRAARRGRLGALMDFEEAEEARRHDTTMGALRSGLYGLGNEAGVRRGMGGRGAAGMVNSQGRGLAMPGASELASRGAHITASPEEQARFLQGLESSRYAETASPELWRRAAPSDVEMQEALERDRAGEPTAEDLAAIRFRDPRVTPMVHRPSSFMPDPRVTEMVAPLGAEDEEFEEFDLLFNALNRGSTAQRR